MQALLGTTAEVMIEGKTKDGLVGRTGTNRLVHLAGPDELLGSLLEVEITEAGTWSLQGRIIGGGMGGLWVNCSHTLWVDRNPDTWQLEVMSRDGAYCGNVVGQIVDPKQCLVRYFIVFQADQMRHFLLPGDSVQKNRR